MPHFTRLWEPSDFGHKYVYFLLFLIFSWYFDPYFGSHASTGPDMGILTNFSQKHTNWWIKKIWISKIKSIFLSQSLKNLQNNFSWMLSYALTKAAVVGSELQIVFVYFFCYCSNNLLPLQLFIATFMSNWIKNKKTGNLHRNKATFCY